MQHGDRECIEAYRRLSRRQWTVIGTTLITMVVYSVTYSGFGRPAETPLAVFVIGALWVFTLLNWRCPACKTYLGHTLNPVFCSSCGARLRNRS
jgi:hypothetical protein